MSQAKKDMKQQQVKTFKPRNVDGFIRIVRGQSVKNAIWKAFTFSGRKKEYKLVIRAKMIQSEKDDESGFLHRGRYNMCMNFCPSKPPCHFDKSYCLKKDNSISTFQHNIRSLTT